MSKQTKLKIFAQKHSSLISIAIMSVLVAVLLPLAIPATKDGNDALAKEVNSGQLSGYSGAFFVGSASPSLDKNFAPPLQTVLGNSLVASAVPPKTVKEVLRVVWVPVTAYSSTPDQTDSTPFITASGTRVRDGIVAANFLPIGAKVRIPSVYGDKVFVVEDRMNARYWLRMDIWMPTRYQAQSWGLRVLPIEIVRDI